MSGRRATPSSKKVIAIVQARDDDGSWVGYYKGNGEKWIDSGCILEKELSGLANRLELEQGKQRKEWRAIPSLGG